jgi:hypothetical protein
LTVCHRRVSVDIGTVKRWIRSLFYVGLEGRNVGVVSIAPNSRNMLCWVSCHQNPSNSTFLVGFSYKSRHHSSTEEELLVLVFRVDGELFIANARAIKMVAMLEARLVKAQRAELAAVQASKAAEAAQAAMLQSRMWDPSKRVDKRITKDQPSTPHPCSKYATRQSIFRAADGFSDCSGYET